MYSWWHEQLGQKQATAIWKTNLLNVKSFVIAWTKLKKRFVTKSDSKIRERFFLSIKQCFLDYKIWIKSVSFEAVKINSKLDKVDKK